MAILEPQQPTTPATAGQAQGNSTYTLQSVVDFVATIGDLAPVMPAGGYAKEPALTIANDVMTEMCAAPFNWKWNRIVVPPFYTNSVQQDYATPQVRNIGWLECAAIVDINNTALPKPIFWIEAVKELQMSSYQFGRPAKVAWLPNSNAQYGQWPGAGKTYTNPIGAPVTPFNPPMGIVDANGNILVLTQYGVTGEAAPCADANAAAGTTVEDGSCVWTVADPYAQAFRLSPMPGQTGLTWQVHVFAQAKPKKFTSLSNTLAPIPDDCAKHFRDGFIAYCYRHSPNPGLKARFQEYRNAWLQSMMQARTAADREKDDAGFYPDRNIMASEGGTAPIGPAWPFSIAIG